MKTITIAGILTVPLVAGIGLALAQPSPNSANRDLARSEALAKRGARLAAVRELPPGPDPGAGFATTLPARNFREDLAPSAEDCALAAGCEPGTLAWRRARELELCASVCNVDADCAAGERCRVARTSVSGPHAAELADDAPPGIEDDGADDVDDDGDDTVRLCDPLWEEPDALGDLAP